MFSRFVFAAALAVAVGGCGSKSSKSSSACPWGKRCDSSRPSGPVHGKRADGSVDVGVEQVWPDRPTEPDPLSGLELLQACVALAACSSFDPPETGTLEGLRRIALSLCAQPAVGSPSGTGPGSYFWEERAVPSQGENERWTFKAREMIAAAGNCAEVRAVPTQRATQIQCEEAGCWWRSPDEPIPGVTCAGEVATLTSAGLTLERDCSRAFARCDEQSPTGCTDRAPVACEHPAEDRCDGALRLGCDGGGRVSFRDCSRVPGGTCGDIDGSLGCIYPDAGQCGSGPAVCDGESLSICVFGAPVLVDCKALGLGACKSGLCPEL